MAGTGCGPGVGPPRPPARMPVPPCRGHTMSLRRHLWIWSTLGAGLLAAAAWWAGGDTSWRRVAAAGVLRVGYAVEAPYAFLTADGVPTGEGPESARQIAQRLGLARVDFVQVPFAELIPGLLERRYDLIAAGLFVTAERATRVRFSAPTVRVRPGLLVPRGSSVRSAQDAVQSGLRVAVLAGSVEEQRLQALGHPAGLTVAAPDLQSARVAMDSGRADVLLLSLPTLRWLQASDEGGNTGYEVWPDTLAAARHVDEVAFAFHPQDAALQRAWARVQRDWVASAQHVALVGRYGFTDDEVQARHHDGATR